MGFEVGTGKGGLPWGVRTLMRRKQVDSNRSGADGGHHQLAKELSVLQLIAIGVGSTIGAGVYVLIGTVAREHSGPALTISFLIAGIAAALSAFCYAELASRCPSAGSAYHYSYICVGEGVAWLIGWALILEYTIGGSAVARGISPNLALFFGGPDSLPSIFARSQIPGLDIVVDPCAAVLVLIVTALLCVGIKESSFVQSIVTTANVCVMIFVVVAGAYLGFKTGWVGYSVTSGYFPYGADGMLSGAATIFFAYIGFDSVASTAEEVKNPQRDLPLGIGLSLSVCCILYMLVSIVIVGLVPYFTMDPDTPISSAFASHGMQWAVYVITAGAILALCATLMGSILPQPRILMAMSRDGLLPPFFADVNKKTQVPVKSTIVTGVCAAALAFFMDVSQLAGMEISGNELIKALQIESKIPRRKAIAALEEKVIAILTEDGYVVKDGMPGNIAGVVDVEDEDEDEVVVDGEVDEGDVHIKPIPRKILPMFFSEVDVKLVFKEVSSKFLRKRIVEGGRRSDGRSPWEIRPINAQCGLLPRAHGSALFTRGETQSLAVVTLGDKQMAQRIDNLVDTEEHKRFYLQYSFPPSCVGEAGRVGAPSRREIGHGMLAERALEPILPSDENFPYTVRVESTITESNGSSSMASVCGGCLALLDAGVPVKCSVAGIAMGMVLDTKEFGGDGTPLILSDITGAEDASGDMDFKVAGDENGITAFQMDIKVGGITLEVMERALLQARDGRKHILSEMLKCSSPPSRKLSKHAPLIHVMKVNPDKVNAIIGTGGKKVKSIIDETGVEAIEAQDDGIVKITARDLLSLEKSKAIIANLTMVPKVGDIYRNCEIKSIAPYGIFVEIAPGREGLCHISELSSSWLAKAEDIFKVGDRLDVKLIEINEKGHLRLSRRALLPDEPVDQTNVKGDTGEQVKESSLPQIATDGAKMTKSSGKDGLPKQGAEQAKNVTKDKSAARKPSFPKEVTHDKSPDRTPSQEKDIRRLSNSAKNGPYINKDRQEKDSDKMVSEANTSIDGTSIISGEAVTGR